MIITTTTTSAEHDKGLESGWRVVVGGRSKGGGSVNIVIEPPIGGWLGGGRRRGVSFRRATRGRRDRPPIKPHPGRADRDSSGTIVEHTTRRRHWCKHETPEEECVHGDDINTRKYEINQIINKCKYNIVIFSPPTVII